MAQKLTANLPDTLQIGDGYIIELDAVDPTTGASVAGVVVTNLNATGEEMSAAAPNVGSPILIGVNT